MNRRVKVWAGLCVVAVLSTGCSGGDGDEQEPRPEVRSSEAPRVPELQEAWTSNALDPIGVRSVQRVDDVVLVTDARTVVGLDAATGVEQWRLPSRRMCGRPEPAAAGRVVVSFDKRRAKGGKQDGCSTLALVDVATGKAAWQRKVGDLWANVDDEPHALAVGARTITTREDSICGGIRRFDLATGKPLRGIAPVGSDGYACDGWAFDGRWIAHEETSDFGDADFLSLYDADTGKRAFRRAFPGLVLGDGIYSADPLVLDIADHGHRLLWTVDPANGRLLQPISEQWAATRHGQDAEPLGSDDGTVLVARGNRAAAYRLEGGPVAASGFPAGGQFVGLDDGLIAATQVPATDVFGPTVITRHAVDDVTAVEVLGATPDRAFVGVVDGFLLTRGGGELVARALPEPGAGPDVPEGLDVPWDAEPAPFGYDASLWEDGDVRPDEVENCPLSDQTLRTLGFHRLSLPRPDTCEWVETAEPDGTRRELSVSTFVGQPAKGEPDSSATDAARKHLAQVLDNGVAGTSAFDPVEVKPARLPDVGDEAWIVQGAGLGGRDTNVALVVRISNVVVHVIMRQTTDPYTITGVATPYDVEAGAWAALDETLEGAGLTVDRPTPRVPAAPALSPRPDLCARLAPAVSAALPGVPGRDLRPKADRQRRVAGCAWNTGGADGNHDGIQVSMYATAPSALTGASGVLLARRAWAYTNRADSSEDHKRRIDGLGDQAQVLGWDTTWIQGRIGDTVKWQGARVDLRQGNLTVTVVVQRRGLSTASLEDAAVDLARAALATQAH